MDLILWRHAHAGDPWADPVADLARPLSARGRRQAERMGAWLSRHLTDSTRVLASPALRAQQTAEALGRPFRTVHGLAPGCGVEDLLSAARFPEGTGAVLVVGHQDTLGLVAARLMHAQEQAVPWTVRKGAVWWWRLRRRDGVDQCLLHAVVGPELVDGSP